MDERECDSIYAPHRKRPSAPAKGYDKNRLPSPPRRTRGWKRYLLSFGVSVGVGLAPYLGNVRVPLFSPLLDLIPATLQNTILPLSTALMGVVALSVQWYGGERVTRKRLRRAFYCYCSDARRFLSDTHDHPQASRGGCAILRWQRIHIVRHRV